MTYIPSCKCGWTAEPRDSQKLAECVADAHESAQTKRQYRHSTEVIAVDSK